MMQKRKRRTITAGLALVLAMGTMAACGQPQEAAAPASGGTGAGEIKLQMSLWGDDSRKKAFEEIAAKYKASHPNVSVEIVLIPMAEYQQKLSIMMASKTAPDVVWLAEKMIPQFVETGQLVDLTPLQADQAYDFGDLFPSTLDIYKKDGKLYGIPFTSPPKVLFYNKNLFKEKGLKTPQELFKEGKWTYEEFAKTAKALTDPAKGVYGMNLFGANGWKGWQDALMETLWANGGELFSADSTTFALNSPQGEQTVQFLYDAIFKEQSHLKPGDQTTFETGKIAMVRNNYSSVAAARKITDFEWDIAPMPQGTKKDAPTAVGLAGYSIVKDSKNQEAAMEFVKYMTSKEGMAPLAGTFIPNRKSVLQSDAFLKADKNPSPEGIQMALIDVMTRGVRVQPSHKNWQQIDVKIQTLFDLLYTKSETPKSILERMEKEVSPLMK